MPLNVIETASNHLFVDFNGTGTFYEARVITRKPDCIRVKVVASSSGETSFRSWGEKRDGIINLSPLMKVYKP